MTASSFMKVDVEGNILAKPEVDHGYGLHTAAFVIHSAIYKARPDVTAVMHTHTIAGMAVSSLKCGFLPLTQTSHRFYPRLAYHDFNGPERDPSERENLARHLADKDFARAQQLDPADPTAWLYSALHKHQTYRLNVAVRDLERSVELNDNRSVFRSRTSCHCNTPS